MNELQTRIKKELENEFIDKCKEKLEVEFVSDVSERAEEILSNSQMYFYPTYDGDVNFGVFLPPMYDDDVYHILLLDNREDSREIMTAAHELEHAILHFNILRTVYKSNTKELYKGFLYRYFQIFSEFSAFRKGMSQYLRRVRLNGISLKEQAIFLLEEKLRFYLKNVDTPIREDRLMQHYIFLGNIIGVLDVMDFEEITFFVEKLHNDESLAAINTTIFKYKDDLEWYEEYLNVIEDYLCT